MRTGTDGRYHFCYATINTVNQTHYIGKRTTKCVDDGYLGSGTLITAAIKKHGRDAFVRVELSWHDNEADAYENEVKLIAEARASGIRLYNILAGGASGPGAPNAKKGHHGPDNFWFGKNRSGENNPRWGVTVKGTKTAERIGSAAKARYAAGMVHPVKGKPKTQKQIAATKQANSKSFAFVSPQGEQTTITNLAQFCKDNGLSEACMRHVSTGRNRTHKGWTNGIS